MLKITSAQLREPGVSFTSEGRGVRQELYKRTKVQNRVIVMSCLFCILLAMKKKRECI